MAYLEVRDANGVTRRLRGRYEGDEFVPENETVATVKGSNGEQDLRGLAANRPAADAVVVGTTYWSVDTGAIEVSDGTNWNAV